MTDFADRVDGITVAQLRATGATKWTYPDGQIGAFVAEMDFGVAPVISAALHQAVDDGAFGYMPPHLTTDLSIATSEFLARKYGWAVDAADVQAVPDVIVALEFAIKYTSTPGSKVIVPTPAYMPFLSVPPVHGREVIEVPLAERDGRYVFDLDALQQAFDDGGNLLLLCNPYNPVGRVFERDELLAIADLVERNNGRVFADEIWAPLVYPAHTHIPYASISAAAAGHTMTALSASKSWNLPGLKCAQIVVSNDKDRDLWASIGFLGGHGTSNLGVIASTVAYREGGEWLDDTVRYLEGNRDRLVELVASELPGAKMHTPEGTYVAWIDFRGTAAAENPSAFFKEHAAVVLTPGTACGQAGAGFARLIFATPRPILEQVVRQMGAALRESAN